MKMDLNKWWQDELTEDEREALAEDYRIASSEGVFYPLVEGSSPNEEFERHGCTFLGLLIEVSSRISGKLVKKLSTQFIPVVLEDGSPQWRHFYYLQEIKAFYKWRDSGFLEDAIEACKRQIAISKEAFIDLLNESTQKDEDIARWEKIVHTIEPLAEGDDRVAKLMREKLESSRAELDKIKSRTVVDDGTFIGPEHTGYKQLCIIFEKQGKLNEAIEYATQAKSERWGGDWDSRIEKLKKKSGKVKK